MSELLDAIDNLPDISFIDNITLEDVQNFLVSKFEMYYKQITGVSKFKLQKGDPYRIILLSNALLIYQGLQNIDRAGKMNLIKYAYGDFLKHLAAFKNTQPKEPQAATVHVKWSLEEPRGSATPIPEGSRVTADYEIYFETTEYNEIPAGETEIILKMVCTVTGEAGNDFAPGELKEMVDPLGFIDAVANIDTSSGGTGEESDQSLAERAYLAPSGYSTAGPVGAYIHHVKSFNPEIGDVYPSSPSAGVVDIRFIMEDGSLPDSNLIEGLTDYLMNGELRPFTDKVQVGAPSVVEYQIDATYYINKSDQSAAAMIQSAVEQALDDYKSWQRSKIGRDINPDELRSLMKYAGIKRAVITKPAFTVLQEGQVAKCTGVNVRYGGLEND